VILAVDVCFLVVFLVMTYAFGFFSKLLFVFLLDIDVLYVLRIVRELAHVQALAIPIALTTLVLMALALYIAFALVFMNAAGRAVLPMGGPLFRAGAPASAQPAPNVGSERPPALAMPLPLAEQTQRLSALAS
jgi:hypothetical protein